MSRIHLPLLPIFVLAWFASSLWAQTNGEFFLDADALAKRKQIWLGRNLKYHHADDSAWADPAYDDSDGKESCDAL